jgi:hypothetical protein
MDPTFHYEDSDAEGDDEIPFIFDPLDIKYTLSVEDYKELMNREQPGILDWKDYPCTSDTIKNLDVCFTFDKAKTDAWNTAKEEIDAITYNTRQLFGLPDDRNLSDNQIYSIFFSKDSRIANILLSKLEVDYVTLLKWLHDSCFQAYYGFSHTDLYNDRCIEEHLLLNRGGNYGIWEQIATVDQTTSTIAEVGRRGNFLYEQLQDEYNAIGRKLCIENRRGRIEIVVDDDKVFHQKGQKKDCFGLKYVKHVQDI